MIKPVHGKILQKILPLLLLGFFLHACTPDKKTSPATAIDTGRDFIRASLDGDFSTAEKLLVKDTQNEQMFETYKAYYEKWPADKKQHFKKASYTINKWIDIDSATTIINYSNDYMNKPMEIKVSRQNNEWKVDFTYTSSGNLPIN